MALNNKHYDDDNDKEKLECVGFIAFMIYPWSHDIRIKNEAFQHREHLRRLRISSRLNDTIGE